MLNDQTAYSRMATELPTTTNGAQNGSVADKYTMKTGLARMLKGGVIMDVVNAEQASLTCADLGYEDIHN